MTREQHVDTLSPGDPFRDWLVSVLDGRIRHADAPAEVYLIRPASHTVCRYAFRGEGVSVVSKFFAEPTGTNHRFDPEKAMETEYRMLKKARRRIAVPEPIAVRADYHCALVTGYVRGRPLLDFLRDDPSLFGRLTDVAGLLRRLHGRGVSAYDLEREFATFQGVLGQVDLSSGERDRFTRRLDRWQAAGTLERRRGCMIHRDATPSNYLFGEDGVVAVDFESAWTGAHPAHDPGILCAEIRYAFRRRYGDAGRAEPYLGHFLWHYAGSDDAFRYVTGCVPFFMALGYLRMARLSIGNHEKEWLKKEAFACLRHR
ncbi:phosphotransferase family protein [Methanofollis ethanolicus]|uniref:phosphotransferase family protein n=1 Tax=Methanofollis ethanolicus TaxID=488124 RepID=UPI00082F88B1|nr:aminoglycoside phosphotransferase family protein [Methanofollis ethanolicus]